MTDQCDSRNHLKTSDDLRGLFAGGSPVGVVPAGDGSHEQGLLRFGTDDAGRLGLREMGEKLERACRDSMGLVAATSAWLPVVGIEGWFWALGDVHTESGG
jgi:hypothetical protein